MMSSAHEIKMELQTICCRLTMRKNDKSTTECFKNTHFFRSSILSKSNILNISPPMTMYVYLERVFVAIRTGDAHNIENLDPQI